MQDKGKKDLEDAKDKLEGAIMKLADMYDIDRYNTNFICEASVFFKGGARNADEFVVI